jgi:hypothetical protein
LIPYFPFDGQPFKRETGLKILDLERWIEPDANRESELALKKALLRDQRAQVLAYRDELASEAAARELLDTLKAHMAVHFPECLAAAAAPSATPPLEQIAGLVQEDFCLLDPDTRQVMAGLVCFPSRWKISDKIGLDPAAVHQPVAGFHAIARPTMATIQHLVKPVWRLNWTIHDSDELFSPEPVSHHTRLSADEVLHKTFLRVERQTLRRLPQTGAVAFSIRTYIAPMNRLVGDPERRRCLQISLDSLPDDVAHYKGMGYFLAELRQAVRAVK